MVLDGLLGFLRRLGREYESRLIRQYYKQSTKGRFVNKNPDPYGEEEWVWEEKVTKIRRKCYVNVTHGDDGVYYVHASYEPDPGAVDIYDCNSENEAHTTLSLVESYYSAFGKVVTSTDILGE